MVESNEALTRQGLFRLVTDEAFRDGVLEDSEKRILQVLARFLKLDGETAMDISRRSKEAFRKGELAPGGTLDPAALYLRVEAAVRADGVVDNLEAQMLTGLRQILKIDHLPLATLEEAGRVARVAAPESLTRERLAPLAQESSLLASGFDQDPGAVKAGVRAREILALLAEAPPVPAEIAGEVAAVAANLAPSLVAGGGLDELERFVAARIVQGLFSGCPGTYRAVLANAAHGMEKVRPGDVVEVVRMAERLATTPSVDDLRVEVWIQTMRRAAKVAFGHRDMDMHAAIVEGLERIPPRSRAAAAGARAGILADMVILGLHQGRSKLIESGLDGFRALAGSSDDPEVRCEQAQALCCLIEAVATEAGEGRQIPGIDLSHVRRCFDDLGRLVAARSPDADVVKAVSAMAPFGLQSLVAMDEPDKLVWFLGLLRRISTAGASDETVQVGLARAMVNTAILVKDRPRAGTPAPSGFLAGLKAMVVGAERPVDPVEEAVFTTMKHVVGQCPSSPDVGEAAERFARVTGKVVLHGAAAGSGAGRTGASGGSGRTPVPSGWKDQDPGWPVESGVAALSFPTPMAAVDALEDAGGKLLAAAGRGDPGAMTQASEAYFHALRALYILDTEMGRRKATYGRLARAVMAHLARVPSLASAGMLGMHLDHLAEDLGDSGDSDLADEGRRLGRALEEARSR